MKLTEIKLQNYRSYRNKTSIAIDDLTVIIGRNDAGKSTILEALDVFFNNASPEKEDACVRGDARDVRITCVFRNLPGELVLDEQHPTTLGGEYLLRRDGHLEVCRVYDCSGAKGKQTKIFVKAHHPTRDGCSDLHSLKITPLKTRARELGVDLTNVNQTIKTELRKAIWGHVGDLQLQDSEIDLAAETGKAAWDQIELHLPVYALFKSDRASTDQDGEAQDPMKAAIKEVVKNHEQQLTQMVDQVKAELERVAKRTVEKIQEMSPALANTLDPIVKNKNWDSLFSVSLTGEEGISINKRGSGTRRLVLLNFFRAKAEDAANTRSTGVIYAPLPLSSPPSGELFLWVGIGFICRFKRLTILHGWLFVALYLLFKSAAQPVFRLNLVVFWSSFFMRFIVPGTESNVWMVEVQAATSNNSATTCRHAGGDTLISRHPEVCLPPGIRQSKAHGPQCPNDDECRPRDSWNRRLHAAGTGVPAAPRVRDQLQIRPYRRSIPGV